MSGLVVVGASLAGVHAAQGLRRAGFDGPIHLVGAESHRPYDRPPLSKDFLTDEQVDEDRLVLRPVAEDDALDLTWYLGTRAVALSNDHGNVELSSGETLAADGVVVATGCRPRHLPPSTFEGRAQSDVDGVVALRTLNDARQLRRRLRSADGPVVVCGAGFIGAEVAASARQLGCEVTMVELAEAPLARVLDAEAGMAVVDLHRSHGVDVRLGVGVDHGHTDGGRLTAVTFSDGTELACAVLVVGIGVIPNTEWLEGSGLTVGSGPDNGVLVDDRCRAAPSVVAVGDVARRPHRRFGGTTIRVEQWDNAVAMGGYGAKSLLAALEWRGDDGEGVVVEPFDPVPWFWSDQYDRKIQFAGIATDDPEMIQGSAGDRQFVRAYFGHDGRVVGVLAWNRPRQAIIGRQLIEAGADRATVHDRLG